MIAYCMTKDPDSILCQIQQRLWRDLHPQADFVCVQTGNPFCTTEVNRCLNGLKATGHRYMVCFHEDCIPLKHFDIEKILNGKTFAARVVRENKPHPSRTWLAADCETSGMTVQPYAERDLTKDDVSDVPDDLRPLLRYLEPGWLHLDSWYKMSPDAPVRKQKRDWILSHFSAYAELPKLTTRLMSFARAASVHVGKGFPHVPLEVWQKRREICDSCDAYDANRGVCRHCGCGIKTKSRWRGQECPIGRWPVLVEGELNDDHQQA